MRVRGGRATQKWAKTPPHTPKKSLDEEIQLEKLKINLNNHENIIRENENKIKFLQKMNKTYYRIRNLGDNIEVDEPENFTATQSPSKVTVYKETITASPPKPPKPPQPQLKILQLVKVDPPPRPKQPPKVTN